jgi:catechol 2,3-dioxygenase-like lactoylglutathione lyase family enzyme
MDYQLQVVTLSVSDVDKATEFYTKQAGFTLDVDYRPASGFRVVQLTPPGSACSVQIGTGLTDAPPGSARATCLVVTDIEAARRELTDHASFADPPTRTATPGSSSRSATARHTTSRTSSSTLRAMWR